MRANKPTTLSKRRQPTLEVKLEEYAHTPEPWFILLDPETDEPDASFGYAVQSNGNVIADHIYNKVDADVVCAAPMLLKSALYIHSAAPCQPADGSSPLEDEEMVEIIITGKGLKDLRAALAKAKGQH